MAAAAVYVSSYLFLSALALSAGQLTGYDSLNCNTTTHFDCQTGQCIPILWRCDGSPDCSNGLDERGCKAGQCTASQFSCPLSKKCIPFAWRCDGDPDCYDNDIFDTWDEDPAQCGVKSTCPWNTLLCPTAQKCLHVSQFCDGKDDCDGEDELHCSPDECPKKKCTYKCQMTSQGAQCYCPFGFKLRSDNASCVDADECELDGSCDQLCLNNIGSFRCTCVPGYQKVNSTGCVAVNVPPNEPPYILLSTAEDIRKLDLNGSDWPGDSVRKDRSTTLEFDHRNHRVCYIQESKNRSDSAMYCADIDGLSNVTKFAQPSILNFNSVFHIALDWVSGNWYFLDDFREMIYLCSGHLKYCLIIIDVNLNKPHGIALDPTKGYMFFTKWGTLHPMLERAQLDGTSRKILVSDKIVYPYGITVDYAVQHVYWVDMYLDFIERIDYDGHNRKTIRKGFPVQTLFDIAVFENNLYVTSWKNQSVIRINKFQPNDFETLFTKSKPYYIHIYHRQRQPDVAHPCKNKNGGCSHICVPAWNNNIAIAKCYCQNGHRLLKNGKCVPNHHTSFLLYGKSRPGMIKGLPMLASKAPGPPEEAIVPVTDLNRPATLDFDVQTQFIYWADQDPPQIARQKFDGNHREIWMSDEVTNCKGLAVDWIGRNLYWIDGTMNTGTLNVAPLERPLLRKYLHTGLPYARTVALYLETNEPLVIWTMWDGAVNASSSIQASTTDGTNLRTLVSGRLLWPSGLTVDTLTKTLYWCDAKLAKIEAINLEGAPVRRTIVDGKHLDSVFGLTYFDNYLFWTGLQTGNITAFHLSDSNRTILSSQNPPLFEIKAFDNKSQIAESICVDAQCPHLCLLAIGRRPTCVCADGYQGHNCTERSSPTCDKTEFKCRNSNKCIHQSLVCDGVFHCVDRSDEEVAPNGPCSSIKIKTCAEGYVQCNETHRCIPTSWVCDGDLDCGPNDVSDESSCAANDCQPTDFECSNGVCISAEYRCDGDDDCRDGSDEKDCELICNSEQYYCSVHSSCLPKSVVCDGKVDCPHGGDELHCPNSTADPICLAGFFCVLKAECLPSNKVCDGHKDCPDGSDEFSCTPQPVNNGSTNATKAPATVECIEPNFQCDNQTRCLEFRYLCDGKPHCIDQSDESFFCEENQCPSSCPDMCHPTPKGPYCYYSKLYKDNSTCPTETGDCRPEGKDVVTPYVIFSNRHEIRSVDLRTYNVRALISSLKNTIALDFHHTPTTDFIYWTDVIDDKIYRGSLIRGSITNIEVVVQTGLTSAEGLAVDWVGENLYWVESGLDQIEVAKLNGSYRRALIAGDMESPRALALDPRYGLLFWTDWDAHAPRIESSAMTGENRKVIVFISDISNGAWPNGLTLDYSTLRVYWIDASSDSIHSVSYDGSDHKIVLKSHELLSHPFAISLYGMHVYWTDWRSNSVLRADKRTGTSVTALQRTLTQPFDIQVLHPSRQPKAKFNPCGLNNGNCSHLCLLGLNSTRSCACPHLMRLNKDSKTCIENDVVLLLVRPNEIRGVDLNQPFYHTIPTISLPQVVQPTAIDFDSSTTSIYWSESRGNHIKMSSLKPGLSTVIVDTGIENPNGFSIDWISKNMFISSSSHGKTSIFVCNLQGEYFSKIYENQQLQSEQDNIPLNGAFEETGGITSLAVDPLRGKLYWVEADWKDGSYVIESSNMDLSNKTTLSSTHHNIDLVGTTSLAMDHHANHLYWVNERSGTIQYMDLSTNTLTKITLFESEKPKAIALFKGILYFLDGNTIKSKKGNEKSQVLRNNADQVTSIKIYNKYSQNGTNACSVNKGNCSQLCLPISPTTRACKCAIGYSTDPANETKCIAKDQFLVYSMNWEMRGLPLNTEDPQGTDILAPISRITMATSIDYDPVEDNIYWADSDHGTITRIHRDGTGRKVVVGHLESSDSLAIDWLTGLAVDWVAGNIYWANPKQKVIEVARSNGSHPHVVVHKNITSPHSLAVDPYVGKLFWADEGTNPHMIFRSDLDGSDVTPIQILGSMGIVSGLALNTENKLVYWSDAKRNSIFSMDYSGNNLLLLQHSDKFSPYALAYHDNIIYWIDLVEKGSIKSAEASVNSTVKTLSQKLGDSLKDLTLITRKWQPEYRFNPCKPGKNHCAQLCLFDGTEPICRCSHGLPSGGSCASPDAFLAYSLVDRIDTVNLVGDMDHNPPLPSIASDQFMKNAIGLTYDYSTKTIFYSDIQKGSINAVHFDGSNHRIIAERQGSVEGLTFGVIENSLYWTCNNIATIFKMSLASSNSTPEIVLKLYPWDKPRGIAVDVCNSRLYWTNWNNQHPSIQRSFTNGRLMEAIITTEIRMPNAITIDDLSQKLFWADARLDKIERCEFDGSDRIVLTSASPQHPFAMAVYGEYIYWTDWVVHSVVRANKFTGADATQLRRDVGRPMGIAAVYNSSYNCFNNPCRILNGGCSQLCKLDVSGTVKCSCHIGLALDNDGKRCVPAPAIAKPCSDTEFTCENSGCIPYHLTCDGIHHCVDKSDESTNYCATRRCREGYFSCTNGRCVHANQTCNTVNNCGDYSDEIECECTAPDYFKCKSGPCIQNFLRCDNDPDCPDASDEMGCPVRNCLHDLKSLMADVKFNKNPFINCNHTTACILQNWICDGQNDCWDGSDEVDCPGTDLQRKCPSFTCDNGACLSMEWVCDGEDDCRDNSDEKNCHTPCNEFTCKDEGCIPSSWVCDGTNDCADGSDESGNCQKNCTEYQFKCNSTGKCIPLAWVCDETPDCLDDSDEEDCLSRAELECGSPSSFRCLNGRCIPKEYYCDHENDCGDNSDESNCAKGDTCPSGYFTCHNGRCVALPLVCNGHNDCEDFSDEELDNQMCSNATCVGEGLFECKNSLCINETLTCDGENNCGDYSDEEHCNIDECAKSKPCAHNCTDLKVGYVCTCLPGYKPHHLSPNVCVDLDECSEGVRPCDQVCTNKYGSFSCSCKDNFSLRPDGRTCKAVSQISPHLILTNKYYIRKMDFTGNVTLLVKNLTNAVAVDYDWTDKCIYWSDVTTIRSSLNRLCENSTAEVLHHTMLTNPDGLAVDWIGRNLYWCDKGTDKIEVSKLDGKHRRTLVTERLKEPRAVALLPQKGYLFWTDWSDQPHIGRAGMDGSQQRVIVTERLGWPNALTVDYEAEHLYWADAREDYIAMCNYDGGQVKILADRTTHPKINLHHVFSIAVFESYIFWTDWETKTVEKCTKYGVTECKSIGTTIHRPMDIRVLHPFKQPSIEPNPCLALNCSALCLLSPNTGKAHCACPNDFIVDPKNSSNCIANCSAPQIKCETTYKCINSWWKCDGQDDCGDGSDEPADCRKFVCHPGQFQCLNQVCTHPSHLCNGLDDCGDRSDEMDCNNHTCMEGQFKCPPTANTTAKCIVKTLRCNGHADCAGGEDEEQCAELCQDANRFMCANGHCIPNVWACDGADDCGDRSDERVELCQNRTCAENEHRCHTGRCLPMSWVCDGAVECPDLSDESESCKHNTTCDPTYFKCNNTKCIPGRWKCDNEDDCGDKSDELNCAPRPCSESEFRCNNGRCLQFSMRCDGEIQCEDHSDEIGCQIECGAQEFKCVSPPRCIYQEWVCDGDRDCVDGSDEANCTHHVLHNPCSNSQSSPAFACANDCIPQYWVCDGENDCLEGEDEEPETCKALPCPPDKFRCGDHKCIPYFKVCNKVVDCADGSDELPTQCKKAERCGPNAFSCFNDGRCIPSTARCDGEVDCSDSSDEIECSTQICSVGACSQLCITKEARGFSCRCVEGYVMKNDSCVARGPGGLLMIATDKEIRLLDPYKAESEAEEARFASRLSFKTPDSHLITDVAVSIPEKLVFPSTSSQIFAHSINPTFYTVNPQMVFQTSRLFGNESSITSVAYDWTTQLLYVARDSDIFVTRFNAETGLRQYKTLLQRMGRVHILLLDVERSRLFWMDTVRRDAFIYVSNMDGTNVRTLLSSMDQGEILWPTDLAVDRATGRLYFADVKHRSVGSINVNGREKRLVYKAEMNMDLIPYKIEVFEDTLYVATFHSTKVLKMNKFSIGTRNMSVLINKLDARVVRLSMIQIQAQNVSNDMCKDYCHESAICLRTPNKPVCSCPNDMVPGLKSKAQDGSLTCVDAICHLKCLKGKCKMGANGAPYCSCDPLYSGTLCEVYRCSGYCKNKGSCYLDTEAPTDQVTGLQPLKCRCSNEWTGDRCQTPNKCCLNGGTCLNMELGVSKGFNKCACPPGYTGQWCELCPDLNCLNGAICLRDEFGRPACNCTPGFEGPRCEIAHCDGFCLNGGTCHMASGPACSCPAFYEGKRCETQKCRCFNGGTCQSMSDGSLACNCPIPWFGPMCEVNYCDCSCPTPNKDSDGNVKPCHCPTNKPLFCPEPTENCHCRNGGSCVIVDSQPSPICKCPSDFIGTECEIHYLGLSNICDNYCQNDGVCTLLQSNGQPHCTCLDRTRSGKQCEECNLSCSEDSCVNTDECACVKCSSGALTALFLWVVILFFIVVLVVSFFHARRKARRLGFDHSRIRENVEITNPMYEGHLELTDELPMTPSDSVRSALNLSRNTRGNFDNPVYAMMEEKANLLEAG